MKHNNIAIFIPHLGCKNQCSFCNQRVISGQILPPTVDDVRKILQKATIEIVDKSNTEIAFFGGSFTAIDHKYMISLLKIASEFVETFGFFGIRISTRPDCISEDILRTLKQYHVTAIELGAQSMIDEVLQKNNRGHSANDVILASALVKQYGFTLGLQMMIGLYGDTQEYAIETAKKIIEIKPQTVRIYPTVILKGTKLAELFLRNKYKIMSLDEAVSLCAKLLINFENNNISVIKLGLHSSTDVEKDMIGGIYHPAFRELCESKIYLEKAIKLLKDIVKTDKIIILVNEKAISKMVGQKQDNLKVLKSYGYENIKIKGDKSIKLFEIQLKKDV